jgi:hypothetical protein
MTASPNAEKRRKETVRRMCLILVHEKLTGQVTFDILHGTYNIKMWVFVQISVWRQRVAIGRTQIGEWRRQYMLNRLAPEFYI